MTNQDKLQLTLDQIAIQQLMFRYAQACDRKDGAAIQACFSDDIELITPGVPPMNGPNAGQFIADTLDNMFSLTQHQVSNTIFNIVGNTASGETYCTAIHILKEQENDLPVRLEWGIRYQDLVQKSDAGWTIKRRELAIDWQDRRPMSP